MEKLEKQNEQKLTIDLKSLLTKLVKQIGPTNSTKEIIAALEKPTVDLKEIMLILEKEKEDREKEKGLLAGNEETAI